MTGPLHPQANETTPIDCRVPDTIFLSPSLYQPTYHNASVSNPKCSPNNAHVIRCHWQTESPDVGCIFLLF